MSANQMRLLYCIIQIFNQMTTLQENINIKQTLTVAVTQSNKDTEIVLKETTTVDVTIKEENQENSIHHQNSPTHKEKPLPISPSTNLYGNNYTQFPTTGIVSTLLQKMSEKILQKINNPELTKITALRAWHAQRQSIFSLGPIYQVNTYDTYFIWIEAKSQNGQHKEVYTIIIQDIHASSHYTGLMYFHNGEIIPPLNSENSNLRYPEFGRVLFYSRVQLTNEQFLRIYNKNLAGILQHINNPSIKTLVPTNVWVMTGYLYMNAFNYWIWLQAVNNDGTKGNSYSLKIFYQISPVQKDAVSAIFDGLVEPIGGPIFPRIPINYPPKFFPYTQMKTLDNITKLVQENFAQIAQLINYQDNIELTKLTVIKAWISSGPLEHDAPEYIYYWVWLKGETKNNEVGYNIDPQNQYAVELLKKLIPKKGLQVVQTLYGYTQPSK